MIEMFIIAMIVSSVTLRVAGNVAVDGLFAARGKESPRYTRAKARRTPGAATRYWSEVWDDTWTGWSAKRAARKAGQPSTPRARGAATSFWAGWWQDRRQAVRRRWDEGWTVLDEKRREKATRPRPGQQTVPGTVVPNAQDEDGLWDRTARRVGWVCSQCGTTNDVRWYVISPPICGDCYDKWIPDEGETRDRPQDGDGPASTPVPDEDDRTVPQDEHPDPTEDEDGDGRDVPDYVPDFGPDQDIDPSPATPPTEGPTMTTTMPTDTEVVSLNKAIDYSESTARVALEMVNSIDFTESSLAAGGVTGVAVAEFTSAKEAFGSIAAAMTRAAAEFKAQLAIQEAYDAHPGAGSKEFIMGGR